MDDGQIISCHGWSVHLGKVIEAVSDGKCQVGLNNAIALLPARGGEAKENPCRATVEAELRLLCTRLRVPHIDQLLGAHGIGQLAALCFPEANRKQLRVCMLAMLLALLFDDLLDTRRKDSVHELAAALKAALAGATRIHLSEHPLVPLAREVGVSVRALGPSQSWLRRFYLGFNAFFDMAVKAYDRWLDGASLDLGSYLYERYYDIGVGPMLSLMELTHRYELEEDRFDHPELSAFRGACIFCMVFVNDIFSYHKEVVRSGNLTNALAVVQMNHQLSLDRAVAAVVLMSLRCYGEFEQRARGILLDQTLTHGEKRYVDGMRDWMVGALQWSLQSERYRHPESPIPELRTTKPVVSQMVVARQLMTLSVR